MTFASTYEEALADLFAELVDGPPGEAAFVLNPGDKGLLRSLDTLSAGEASAIAPGGDTSVASHVDHLRYGLGLLNRWAAGEDPFAGADYSPSWRRTTVNDAEWRSLRDDLRDEARRWGTALRDPQSIARKDRLEGPALAGVVASVVHLAYHVGAMRQVAPSLRGPKDGD